MAKKDVTARDDNGRGAIVARQIAWLGLAALWAFATVSLASFDSADPPSHVVAVHNEPVANLCGQAGAALAYWSYHVIGVGVWVILAGVGMFLALNAIRRGVTQPFVRFLGVIMVALMASSMHGLLLPDTGPLAGAHAGLIAEAVLVELVPRFSTVGTFLLLLTGLIIGAVVTAEHMVFAVPRFVYQFVVHMHRATISVLRALRLRPERAVAAAGAVGGAIKNVGRRRADGSIDPTAGGLGGTESFDPDAYEDEDDEYEYEDEYEYDDDGEYEPDDEEYDDEYEYDEEEEDSESTQPQKLTAEQLREKISKLPLRMASQNRKVARDEDIPREQSFEDYQFPTLELLEDPETNYLEKMEAIVRRQAEQLEEALHTFGINGDVSGIESGPTVTLYSVQLAPGTKVAKVNSVASDIARALRASSIRVVPNMAGKTAIGIEVPNLKKEKVRLKELMSSGHADGMKLPMFLGKDASGEPLVADLSRMPHMLIAGTTGSGKSVCMNTIIMSWLYTKRPDELKLILVDPKMVELSQFADIPHLMCPVVTEMGRAAAILEWAVNKMEERYELLKEARVRDVESYNALSEEDLYEIFEPQNDEERARIPKKLPFIVFVIDELADLILMHKEVEQHIVRIAQKARAVGIHLILATQRPQANVVTGLIKSNMPCRISFKVASAMDSRIVLDQKGAEVLLGMGDMMFRSPDTTACVRSQGTLVTDSEIRRVARFLKDIAAPTFERSLIAIRPVGAEPETDPDALAERDPLFDKAVEIMIESGRGSVSLLQRRLAIGYSRASRLVDQMGMAGILGEHKGSVARDVMITMEDWRRMKELEEAEETDGTLFEDDSDEEQRPQIETTLDDNEPVPIEYDDEYRQ